MKSLKITDLDNDKARSYFLDQKNYVNFDLPDYFSFKDLLSVIESTISNKNIADVCKKRTHDGKPDFPKYHEKVNYTFLSNKDGAFAWRPLQIIHPILYIDLVNTITDINNWNLIIKRFKVFSKTCVECVSIPRVSKDRKESHRASQVKSWWEEIEQKSIKLALEYDYVFITDITNCYGSIYTHSIEWALAKDGKRSIKANIGINSNDSLGANIDQKLRNMNHGQTNGIPQGSSLMDFIAEMILGYADLELKKALKAEGIDIKDFHILRYRDDYRIFVNNPVIGQQILKELNTVLYNLGMKMNPIKTSESEDIISSSIKPEKMEKIYIAPINQLYQREALRIYQLSIKYSNSGLISKELGDYYDKIEHIKYLKNTDIEVLISIFSMIALSSPKIIPWVSAIVSILLKKIKDKTKKERIIKMIYQKFSKIPNTSFIDVWLQRITTPLGVSIDYADDLTKIALRKIDNSKLWESSWLREDIKKKMNSVIISKLKEKLERRSVLPVISRSEVELFRLDYD